LVWELVGGCLLGVEGCLLGGEGASLLKHHAAQDLFGGVWFGWLGCV
jgi:hypothetical protein